LLSGSTMGLKSPIGMMGLNGRRSTCHWVEIYREVSRRYGWKEVLRMAWLSPSMPWGQYFSYRNTPYLTIMMDMVSTKFYKTGIQDWLDSHNISYYNNYNKGQLLGCILAFLLFKCHQYKLTRWLQYLERNSETSLPLELYEARWNMMP
jgi:hypothetical protein